MASGLSEVFENFPGPGFASCLCSWTRMCTFRLLRQRGSAYAPVLYSAQLGLHFHDRHACQWRGPLRQQPPLLSRHLLLYNRTSRDPSLRSLLLHPPSLLILLGAPIPALCNQQAPHLSLPHREGLHCLGPAWDRSAHEAIEDSSVHRLHHHDIFPCGDLLRSHMG